MLELRMGIEVEAAGLAALRRTDEDIERMQTKLDALDASILAGGSGAAEDFAFHRTIPVATHNFHYARLFDTFGNLMIPRQWARFDTMGAAERQKHIARMRREHVAIFAAIRDRDENGARKTLRNHLTRSAARFAELRDRADRSGA